MQAPVALIIFNRPDTTEKVFTEIAKAKPRQLFIIADGPREQYPDDTEKCEKARLVVERVDWECDVIRNYSDVNLGCGKRPATGISWVFEHTDRAIILEDDCVPNQSFFKFCDDLLKRYLYDKRIMQICGNNFQFGKKRYNYSYYFSRFHICWGWATWSRAWIYHDMGLKLWPELKNTQWLLDIIENPIAVEYWKDKFEKAYKCDGKIDFWDYQWSFACWSQGGLSIMPRETLVSNIGCRPDATHTKNPNDRIANLPKKAIGFPLNHPPYVTRNFEADKLFIENVVLRKLIKKSKLNMFYTLKKRIFDLYLKNIN